MTERTSSLVFKVDSRAVLAARDALNEMTKSAVEAGKAAKDLGASAAGPGLEKVADTAGKAAKATKDLADGMRQAGEASKSTAGAAPGLTSLSDAAKRSSESVLNLTQSLAQAKNAIFYVDEMGGKLAQSYTKQASAELKATQAAEAATAARRQAAETLEREREGLAKLLGQIDPVTRALGRLDEQEASLRRKRAAGAIDNDTFDTYAAKIEASRKALGNFSEASASAGITAKQAANNMRMLPAQITDITVGLATGQKPITVFLQQGGQLKDMFGGIGPAIKATGTALVGMVTPLTVGASVLAAFALAAMKGADEMKALAQAAAKSDGTLAGSAQTLQKFAAQVAAAGGTMGSATETVSKFAAANAVGREQIVEASRAATAWAKATGDSVDDVIANYAKIRKDPVSAMQALNEQYNFLDASTSRRIASLVKQGQEEQAAALAQESYTRMLDTRSKEVIERTGWMEKAWNSLKSAAKGAWDTMADVGRQQSTMEQLTAATARLVQLQDGGYARGSARRQKQVEEQAKIVAGLREQLDAENKSAAASEASAKARSDAVRGAAELDLISTRFADNATKRTQELARVRKAYEDSLKDGSLTEAQRAEAAAKLAAAERGINEQYRDRMTSGQAAVRNTENVLMKLEEQRQVLQAQLGQDTKLLTFAAMRVEYETKFAELKERKVLTASERQLLAEKDQILAAIDRNAELEKEVQHKQALLKLDQDAARVTRQMQDASANRRDQYDREEGMFGMGERLRKQAEAERSIRTEFDRAVRDLRKESGKGVLSDEEINQRVDGLRKMQDAELSSMRDHYKRMEGLQNDWTLSFKEAVANAADNMSKASQIAGASVQTVASSLESSLANAAKTGEFSMKSLTRSILSGLADIAAKMAVSGLFSFFGGLFGGGGGTALGSTAGMTGSWGAVKGAGMAGGGNVRGNTLQEVNERGPELYTENGRTYLMTGADGGRVTPISNAPQQQAGAAGGTNVANVSLVYNEGGSSNQTSSGDQRAEALLRAVRATVQDEMSRSTLQGGTIWNVQNQRV